ncbi:hypothetical protein FISHEDRAFT_77316 [Fistulina hepatica ATCC 64428]|uniref:Retrovirus-related Pol polyprotein from transposon TNT 1-94-like beta-barrel domain-containing protein n=1 Tax=Fistulina hepatica ATCC 64428 TaxID=1128425 RepID=A0A0D7A0X3_9AGAR|nr:hypothetical protein FISHEDRAFT_77316 [Fistulina hepatica ATCC 64428]
MRESLDTLLSAGQLDLPAIVRRLEQEQIQRNTTLSTATETALAAHASGKPQRSRNNGDLCRNCGGKHPVNLCFRSGGAMEGRRDEILKIYRKRREAKAAETKQGANRQHATNNTAKIREGRRFTDSNGKAFILYEEAVTPETAAVAFLSNEATSEDTIRSLCADLPAQMVRTEWILPAVDAICKSGQANVDWSQHLNSFVKQDIPYEDEATYPVIDNTGAFIVDSRSSPHLSPYRNDFLEIHPIPPRPVKGMKGSAVMALGAGTIVIDEIEDGTAMHLQEALYIPQANIRLLSVG